METQQLKVQNSLLLQLVTGLQNQINSKNRENQILFQQYEQLANDNRLLQHANDLLRSQQLHQSAGQALRPESYFTKKLEKEILQLKGRCLQIEQRKGKLQTLLSQREGYIVFLEREKKDGGDQTTLKAGDVDLIKDSQQYQVIQEFRQNQADCDRQLLHLREKNRQLENLIILKDESIASISQFMNRQTQRIAQLTKQSIQTIQNYQSKLTLKQQLLEQKTTQLNLIQQQREKQQKTVNVVEFGKQNQKIKQLEDILKLKEQSINELSQFLIQQQTQKSSPLESQTHTNSPHVQSSLLIQELQQIKQILQLKNQSISDLTQFLNNISQKNRQLQEQIEQLKEKQRLSSKYMQELQAKSKQGVQATIYQRIQTQLKGQLDYKAIQDSQQRLAPQQISQSLNKSQKAIQTYLQLYQKNNQSIEQLMINLESKQRQIKDLQDIVKQKELSLIDFTTFISTQTDKIIYLQGELQKSKEHNSGEQIFRMQRIADLQQILQSKQQSIADLGEYLQENYSKILNLQQKVGQKQQANQQLKKQLQQIKKLVQTLQQKRIQQNGNAQIQKQARTSIQVLETQLAHKKTLCEEIISSLDNQICQKRGILSDLQNTVEEKHIRIESFDEILKTKQAKQKQLTEIIKNLEVKHKLDTEFLQTILKQNQNEQMNLQIQQSSKQAEDNNFMQILATLQQQLADKNQNISNLIRQNEQLKLSLTNLKIIQQNREKELQQQRLSDKQQQTGMMMQILQNLQQELKEKEEIIEVLNNNLLIKKVSQKSPIENVELLKYKQIIADHESSIVQNRQVIQHLQTEIQSLKQQLQQTQQIQMIQNQLPSKEIESPLPSPSQSKAQNIRQFSQQKPFPHEDALRSFQQLNILEKLQQLLIYSEVFQQMTALRDFVDSIKSQYIKQFQKRQSVDLQLRVTFDKLVSDNNSLLQQIQEYQRKGKRQMELIEQFQLTNRNNTFKIECYTLQLQKTNSEMISLKKQLTKAQESYHIKSRQAEAAQQKAQTISQQATVAIKQAKLSSQQARMAQQKADNAIKEGNAVKQMYLSLQKQIKKYQQQKQSLQLQLQELKQHMCKLEYENINKQSYVNELNDEIARLHRQFNPKQNSLEQLKSQKTTKFFKQFNNLLDSDIANKDDELQIQLQKVIAERDQIIQQYHMQDEQMQILKQKYQQLMKDGNGRAAQQFQDSQKRQVEGGQNDKRKQAYGFTIQDGSQQVIGSKVSLKRNDHVESVELPPVLMNGNECHNGSSASLRLAAQIQELQQILQQKDMIICEMQSNIFSLQKGYNKEIMQLRKNIAQLTQQTIVLQKKLYQTNPNVNAITQLIRNNIHQHQQLSFFKPSMILPSKYIHNNQSHYPSNHYSSYYSQYSQPYQQIDKGYSRVMKKQNFNLGQKMMGRKCKGNSNIGKSFFLPSYISEIGKNSHSRMIELSRALAQKQ